MKLNLKQNPACVLSLAALLTASLLSAEPFTYQGRLENSGMPFTGTTNIRLGLYLVASGGIPFRTETFPGVSVSDGIFTVKATSMVADDFTGATRYLGIEVSSDGGTTWTPLLPRQEVTWAPMAMHAKIAETVTGSVAATQLTGTLSPSILGTGSIAGTVTFEPASGAPFNVWSNTKVTNLNCDLFDGFDSSTFIRTTGGTLPGTFNLLNSTSSILLSLDGTGALRLKPGDRGSKVTFGDGDYCTIGESSTDDNMTITANRIGIGTTALYPKGGVLDFGSNTRQMLNLWGTSYGIGVQGDTEYFRSNNHFAWFKGGVHNDVEFNAGTGGSTLMTLSGWGELELKGSTCGYALFNRDNQSKRWEMYSRNNGDTNQLAFYSSDTGDVAAFSPNGDLYLVGALSTTVLTIRGGADVAEPFEMTKPDELDPGTVVVIDENQAGKLKLSTGAYDTKVAGIISGAGGVKPGLRLQQDGVLEGDHHVALSGRVYVKADASTGPIRPGDLLTTSATPGHAMKVTDHDQAQGAILGKAMTGLDSGTGLVLVLVTLQ